MASLRPFLPLLSPSLHPPPPPHFPPSRARDYYIPYAHTNPSRKYAFLTSALIQNDKPASTLPSEKEKKKDNMIPHEVETPNSSTKFGKQGDLFVGSSRVSRSPMNTKNVGSSLMEIIYNIADDLISTLLDPPTLEPSIDPKVQLSGNFTPVPEADPQRCMVVDGVIPPDLDGGVYIRNGPNAATVSPTGGIHVFDGDGMLHVVSFKDEGATYCARYVKTSRFIQEAVTGRPMVAKFFGGCFGAAGLARLALFASRVALGLLDYTKGWGLANTNVAYFGGKILALSEDGMAYVVRVTDAGDVETKGEWNIPGDAYKYNIGAHPKFDDQTGEMFVLGFNRLTLFPHITYFRVSADGVKSEDVHLPYVGDMPVIHDFAITKRYAIFPDSQFVMRPHALVKGERPVLCDKSKASRLGVLPRYVASTKEAKEMRWFDLAGCNGFHYLNAWEEGDEIVLITSILSPPERFLEIPASDLDCTLTEVRLDMQTGLASKRAICSGCLELGTLDHRRMGKRSKFVYMPSGRYPHLNAIVKVDVTITDPECAIVGRREYGPLCYGSEPFFVPCRGGGGEEDRGYLLALVHNEERGSTELLVMDAKTPSLDVLARVKIPCRVPYGFHGCFINQGQLALAS